MSPQDKADPEQTLDTEQDWAEPAGKDNPVSKPNPKKAGRTVPPAISQPPAAQQPSAPEPLASEVRAEAAARGYEIEHFACAAAAHEVNRVYCAAFGDMSHPPWSEAPKWQQDTVMKGVEGVMRGNSPEQNHENWMAEKIADGWKYGELKDVDRKEHPCLMPYHQLPAQQREKDSLFIRTVRSMATALKWAGPK